MHSVWLSSSLCKDEYPSNHGCDFTNELNYPLEFDSPNERWGVAATELIYEPNFWQNMRSSFCTIGITLSNFTTNKHERWLLYAKELYIQPRRKFPQDSSESFDVSVKHVPPTWSMESLVTLQSLMR